MTRPSATYRLQLGNGVGFKRARQLVGYLESLGVGALYASPLFAARPGTSGYHVTDPTRLDPALGSEDEFAELSESLRAAGLGLVLDIVPNHMSASTENPWWTNVLRNGSRSEFARFFDIDWVAGGGRVMLPVLGGPLEEVLDRGEISVSVEHGEAVLRYHEHWFPLAPHDWLEEPRKLERRAAGREGPEVVRRLIDAQHYRLAFWREAAEHINYRRFFDISDLVALRVEEPDVFDAVHALVLTMLAAGRVSGLRVDHVDGLLDPTAYLQRLRSLTDVGGAQTDERSRSFLVVEKILARNEPLPDEWPVEGATGYEFADVADGIFVEARGAARILAWASSSTGDSPDFAEVAAERKRLVLRELFPGEVDALVREAVGLAPEGSLAQEDLRDAVVELTAQLPVYRTYTRDFEVRPDDRRFLRTAFRDARATLPRRAHTALRFLRQVILLQLPDTASQEAAESWLAFVMRWQRLTGPVTAKGVEDTALYVHDGLLSGAEVGSDPAAPALEVEQFHERMRERARRWPGSLNATSTHDTKRSEDVRARLSVLSEVPEVWQEHLSRWREWMEPARREIASTKSRETHLAPDAHEELHILQSIVGAWPLDPREVRGLSGRMGAYAVKAAREAKVHTSWLDPQREHEEALRAYVRAFLRPGDEWIRRDVTELLDRIALPGALNSLAHVLLKVTAPGIPDLFQGMELWNLSLVDPDNRRPVDFALRRRTLKELDGRESGGEPRKQVAADVLAGWRDGRLKMFVTKEALRFRRANRDLFEEGGYLPLEAVGRRRRNVVAFARRLGDRWAIVAVPRLAAGLCEHGPPSATAWRGTSVRLPQGAPRRLQNVLTGETLEITRRGGRDAIRLHDALGTLPVALLSTPESE